jgi:DNA-binding FadR family transcriptional regulator
MKTACRLAALRRTTEDEMDALNEMMHEMDVAAKHDASAWKEWDRQLHSQIALMADNAPLLVR